jgi:hypothetical protein
MRSFHAALLASFVAGLLIGMCFISRAESKLQAQEKQLAAAVRVNTDYAEAELKLTEAQLAYAENANKRLGGGVYPESLLAQLKLKQRVIRAFLDEKQKDSPDLQKVLIEKAKAQLERAKMERDQEMRESMRELRELAVEVAEERLARVQSDEFQDHEKQQDWEIGQLQLELLNIRMLLELNRQ